MYAVIELRKVVAITLCALVLAVSGMTLLAMSRNPAEGLIVDGVRIYGLEVGGLTPNQARQYVSPFLQEVLRLPVVLTYSYHRWRVYPNQAGVEPDLDKVIARAYSVGRNGNVFARWRERVRARQFGINIPLQLSVDQTRLSRSLQQIADAISTPAQDAAFEPQGTLVRIKPSRRGISVDLKTLQNKFLQAAISLNSRLVSIPVQITTPKFTTEMARAMGIEGLVSEYRTRFDPAEENRTNNIKLAASALKGVILSPTEEFSFNDTVGPRLASAGYKPAPVIIEGELLPGIGGGVCQVSTTLYNAVLLAGCQVLERHPHSRPVRYVPLGRDATVAYDYMDLRFINTRPEHILLDAEVQQRELVIRVYGRPVAGEAYKIDNQVTEVLETPVKRVADSRLAPGTERVIRSGAKGYRVQVWRKHLRNGSLIKTESLGETVYYPRERVVHYGGQYQ